MRRPLEVLAVGVVLGELLCLAGIRGILLFLLCLCPALLAFFWRGVRQRILLVLVLGAVAGALRLQLALLPGGAERQLQRAEGVAATFRGRIAEIEPRGELTRVRCGSVYLLLRESDGERLALGRLLTASGSLSSIAAPTNPGEFDYRAYCRARGVTHRMQVREYTVAGRASPLAEGLRRFRSAALERLKAVLSRTGGRLPRRALTRRQARAQRGLLRSLPEKRHCASARNQRVAHRFSGARALPPAPEKVRAFSERCRHGAVSLPLCGADRRRHRRSSEQPDARPRFSSALSRQKL